MMPVLAGVYILRRDEQLALAIGPNAIGFAQFGFDLHKLGLIEADARGLIGNFLSEYHHLPSSIVVKRIQPDDIAKKRIARFRRYQDLRKLADRRVQLPVRYIQNEGTQSQQSRRCALPPIFVGFRPAKIEPGIASVKGR